MAGEEGFEPSDAGIKIRCLDQLGDSPADRPHGVRANEARMIQEAASKSHTRPGRGNSGEAEEPLEIGDFQHLTYWAFARPQADGLARFFRALA